MHQRALPLRFLPALIAIFLFAAPLWARHQPDIVLFNGKIFTVDPGRPWAEALAIRGSRIVAVGDDEDVMALAGSSTQSFDLGGRTVVPGFNDAHLHLGVGLPRLSLPPIDVPGPGPTLDQALDQVAQAVAIAEPGEPILGLIGEVALFDPAAERATIDAVAPDNPVILVTWSSHSAIVNTATLVAAGIAEDEPDPFGGSYSRYPGTDIVNGVVNEYALFGLFRFLRAAVPDEILTAQFEAFTALAAQVGVTSVQEMTIGLTRERSVAVLAAADLKVRMRVMCTPLALDEPCRRPRHLRSRRLTFSGVKWLLDGTPIERSAALRAPYADFPGNGNVNVTDTELTRLVRRSLFGRPVRDQLLTHVVGDRAIDEALEELRSAAPPFIWRLLRPRFEHGDLLHPEQIDLARRLGVIVVQNPTHLALDLVPSLGAERAAAAQPFKSLLDAGVTLALGSDGSLPNPFVDLFFAVFHPFHPLEALSVEEAVTAYTRGSAKAEFEEWRKGSLKPGYLADLAVLSQDIFTIPPPLIPETTSLLTVVGGEIVWDAGAISALP